MSRLWFNIRFGVWHWQWDKDNGVTWKVNPTQVKLKSESPGTWKWFAIYCAFGRHF